MARTTALGILLTTSLLSTGCLTAIGGPMGGRYGRPMFAPPAPRVDPAPALNRWDQVMSLKPNWVIEVLAADGTTHQGRFVRASVRTLYFVTNAGEQALPKPDVIRVDLLDTQATGDTGTNVALGAAQGAATTGGALMLIPFLMTGKVIAPPARLWAFGAAVGAVGALQQDRHGRRARTVYVATLRD